METIVTSECPECKYCILEEIDSANIYVNCSIKKKRYFYGQRIPCNYREIKKEKENV